MLTHVDDPFRAFVGKMLFAVLGGTLTLGLRPLYRRLHRRDVSIPVIIAVSAVCSYVLSVGWTVLHRGGVDLLWEWVDGQPLTLRSFSGLINGALFYTFIPMAWSVLYFGVKYYQDVQAERERALAAEGQAHRARLQALRYQLNPHFLFNTLNAVSTLIVEQENEDAERMVARLSDFLRLTLECDSDVEVPLADELDFARRYLDIEQIRFGGRLVVQEDIEPEALSALVPPLLLQPLVENAVRHGIMPREEGGTLLIEAQRVGDRLLLRVADDGLGLSNDTDTGSGVGLSNTKARLNSLYGEDHRFTLQRADGGGCVVRVELPFHTDSDADFSLPKPEDTVPEAPLPSSPVSS
ncbi:sensor histidine kinase [Salinibacter ruber]|uniref:sensor histidine kinase n=1 Tax=Salinibacter ruber TaxID=146919 RepID=UPI0020730F7C|nr:histidine kinase [Salinibacter ruber]